MNATARRTAPHAFAPIAAEVPGGRVIGESPAFREAMALAERVAERPRTTVLLFGLTGSGKEVLARSIHALGDSADEPFVALNCSAIPETLLESELFGHVQGAFTDARRDKPGLIELAGAGTLFLDELGDMPLSLQPKLLRVIEERVFRRLGGADEHDVRCRIIAGTNVELEDAVAAGRFREDLFYRLNVFRIDLPSLRERAQDIVPLAEHFLETIARERREPVQRLDESARDLLHRHAWPGNVRELRNVIERASILAKGPVIRASDLRLRNRELAVPIGAAGASATAIVIPQDGKKLADIEREAVRLTMIITGGNVSAASRMLGISRPTLLRKMRASGLTRRSLLASS